MKIRHQAQVTYLGYVLDESLSRQLIALNVINNKHRNKIPL